MKIMEINSSIENVAKLKVIQYNWKRISILSHKKTYEIMKINDK